MGNGDTGWRPLSERHGGALRDEGPYEGVPDHLSDSLLTWVRETLTPEHPLAPGQGWAEMVALRLRISNDPRYTRIQWVLWACADNEDVFLDVLDMVLFLSEGKTAFALETKLIVGGSIWTVNESKTGLIRRVSAAEQAAYEEAIQDGDPSARHLVEAWARVYGRHIDPSDAWDHAIKACESVLAPLIAPQSTRATLGTIIKVIKDKPSKFNLRLGASGDISGVEALVHLLQLVWPNPDRHETGTSRRPTLEEARDVVHLAVLLVNWTRTRALTVA